MPWSSVPLLWRVFVTNTVILVVAFTGLVLAPVRVSVPVAASEFVVLTTGLVALLAANLVLLRAAFAPLEALAETMRRHDPLSPGTRASVAGEPNLAALAATFNDMLERLESERRESALDALLIQEAERRRVAHELHDEVGQTLTGAMLQIEGLALSIPTDLRGQLDELRETARHGTEEVRRIARRLRPEALEDLGLRSGLATLAATLGEQAHIDVHRHLESAPALTREQELVIYRVAQEALTNVTRHAGATAVELVLVSDQRRTVLTVDDDGHCVPSESLSSASGIRGMRERAMLIGADLDVHARAEGGTRVRLIVPHDEPAA